MDQQQGNKTLTIVLVIVILIVLGLVAYWFVKRGQAPTSPTQVPVEVQQPSVEPSPTLPGATLPTETSQ